MRKFPIDGVKEIVIIYKKKILTQSSIMRKKKFRNSNKQESCP